MRIRRRSDALRIFISYRRDDSSGETGRLADGLIAQLGRESVYVDVDSLAPGIDFVDQIHSSLEESTLVLAVIGPNWLSASGPRGRRLDDENDYVRLELEAALGRNIPVVPVLVHGAVMPAPADLPPSINRLAFRQAFTLADNSWSRDLHALVAQLQFYFGDGKHQPLVAAGHPGDATPPTQPKQPKQPKEHRRGRTAAYVATAAAVVVALTVGYLSGIGRGGSHAVQNTGLNLPASPSPSPKSTVVKPASLTLAPKSLQLSVGQTFQLNPVLVQSAGSRRAAVVWATQDSHVAQVSKTGLIRAVSPGKASITATAGKLRAAVVVTVLPPGSTPAPVPTTTSTAVVVAADHPPTLSPVAAQHTDEGSAVQFALNGSDPDNDEVTYSALGLPSGLHLSSTTGVISGTISPSAVNLNTTYTKLLSKAFTVTVTAHAHGKVATQRFTWSVRDVEFVMPNYVGYYGCTGDPHGCTDPKSLRNVASYNHHYGCTVNSDPNKADIIASQSPTPGTVWRWVNQVTIIYNETSCA